MNKTILDCTTAIIELAIVNSKVKMALFFAYINDPFSFEVYCFGIPNSTFQALSNGIQADETFRLAVKNSGVLQSAARRFVSAALCDVDWFFPYIDGLLKVFNDPELLSYIPIRNRNVFCAMMNSWNRGFLDHENWYTHLHDIKFATLK